MRIKNKVQINNQKVDWFQTLTGMRSRPKEQQGNPFVSYCIKCGEQLFWQHECSTNTSHYKYPNLRNR